MNTIPALSTNGSLAQGENLWSFYSPQIHQLGGSSSNTTLVVIDGMRMPGGGAQFNQTDPNIMPSSAMQRIDVLADGASSVYGSDAVAGVVNFITRRTFEAAGQFPYANADGYDTWDLNGIWGTTWETGGVYVAAQYSLGRSCGSRIATGRVGVTIATWVARTPTASPASPRPSA